MRRFGRAFAALALGLTSHREARAHAIALLAECLRYDDPHVVRDALYFLGRTPDDRRAQEQLKKRWIATGAWDELEQFYTQTDKLDELIRTLERAADTTTTETSERIALQFRIARLWQEKKNAPDRAARAYEKVLVLDPNDLQAAEALSPLYEQAGDAKKLTSVYEVRLKHVDDPESARMTAAAYVSLLERLGRAGLTDDAEVSVKLSALGLGLKSGEAIALRRASSQMSPWSC